MSGTTIKVGKIVTALVWVLVVMGFMERLPYEWNQLVALLGLFMLIGHTIEIVILRALWGQSIRNPPWDYLNVIVFGFFYIEQIRKK